MYWSSLITKLNLRMINVQSGYLAGGFEYTSGVICWSPDSRFVVVAPEYCSGDVEKDLQGIMD